MERRIAMAGKGGVGKSTCLVLLLKYLIEAKNDYRILVIDADPDANVGDLIDKNIQFENTIGGKMHEIMKRLEMDNIAPYQNAKQAIEADIFKCLIPGDHFDFIEMGRTEGEGCYCNVNNVLSNGLDLISETYDVLLMDSAAGLEHFSRKTAKDVSDLLIVVDSSKMSLNTLKRILVVSKDVSLTFENFWVLGNRFSPKNWEIFTEKLKTINGTELKLLGFIPEDTELMKYNLLGKNLLDLPTENAAYRKTKKLFENFF